MTEASVDQHDVKVSVAMITYNHEAYVAEAIESVLMQGTDFGFELVVGEDCSTDGTRSIVCSHRDRHPDRMRVVLRKRNIGMIPNFIATLEACQGQYIALCEGDDYWTDPHKLQKQVHFLEAHPECSLCFHNVTILQEGENGRARLRYPIEQKRMWSIEDILFRNPISTCSVMFRSGLVDEFPEWYYTLPMGDWPLWVLLATKGYAGYIDEDMATRRLHAGGVFTGRNVVQWASTVLDAYDVMDRSLDFAHHERVRQGKVDYLDNVAQGFLLQASTSMSAREAVSSFLDLWLRHTDSPPPSERVLLGRLYAARFFRAASVGDRGGVMRSALSLAVHDPSHLTERGVWSILVQAALGERAWKCLKNVGAGLLRSRQGASGCEAGIR